MKKNYLYAFITVFIWATMAAVVKKMLFDIPSLQALAVSGVFAFAFLFLLNVKKGTIKKVKSYSSKDYAIMSGLGFLGLFLYTALYYYGLSQLTSQEACILNYLWPMMLVVFSCIILKEKMTFLKAFAIVCSFIGIVILSWGSGSGLGDGAMFGIISCIVAAACYGLFSVLNKRTDYDQGFAMMINWLVVVIFATLVGVLTEDWVAIRGVQWLGLLWVGVFTDGLAYLLWALALKGADDTAKIANIAYLVPFLSLIISAIFLDEIITWQAGVAVVFIIGGILLQSICEHKQT